ncbi:MAG: hypothetical protein VX777_10600 [Chlamydiota bacterium]|nr:hypothetical protein [Chlamydiota bacterium]
MSQLENLEIDQPEVSDEPLNVESGHKEIISEQETMNSSEENPSKEQLPENTPESVENNEISTEVVETKEEGKESMDEKSEKGKSKKSLSTQVQKDFEEFKKVLDATSDFDEKLKLSIEKMEAFLSQGGTPQFKYFWEIRRLCLDFFKENISPAVRATYWPKYSELSKEARRLKEIFDEQSAFAVEQINMAIDALEADLDHFEDRLQNQDNIDFQFESQFLEKKIPEYNDFQKRLNLLNAHASRVNTLRKELMKVDMRIKQKNKFFQRLSEAGDKIFPLRKDLIKKVSDQFIQDIERFISTFFTDEESRETVFFLRQEIKSLQGIAKVLTLNTISFTTTRLKLSECWDKLKVVDKERKKERAEKREVFKQNKEEVHQKIVEFTEKFNSEQLSTGASEKMLNEIQTFMRKIELGRDEVKTLREEMAEARKLVTDKMKAEEEVRLKEEKEKLRVKKEKVDGIRAKISDLISEASELTADEVENKRSEIQVDMAEFASLSTREKNELERPLRSLNDVIDAKKEEALLNLSEDDQEVLQNLREVLKQRKKRRKEVKEQYDTLRKAAGGSGLDIEKAMLHHEQVNAEKERLDSADDGILEIETKIAEIKKKIS